MLRCAITNGTTSGFVNASQIERLKDHMQQWAAGGIDIIQVREKNLEAGQLLVLIEAALQTLCQTNSSAKLVVNGRADVAIAARAHGVHLTAHPDELTPHQVRSLFSHADLPAPVVTVSCHTPDEIARARDSDADFILFGPVFEKRASADLALGGVGLERLAEACSVAARIPVLALGGITSENAAQCMQAGAAGIAAIRLFST